MSPRPNSIFTPEFPTEAARSTINEGTSDKQFLSQTVTSLRERNAQYQDKCNRTDEGATIKHDKYGNVERVSTRDTAISSKFDQNGHPTLRVATPHATFKLEKEGNLPEFTLTDEKSGKVLHHVSAVQLDHKRGDVTFVDEAGTKHSILTSGAYIEESAPVPGFWRSVKIWQGDSAKPTELIYDSKSVGKNDPLTINFADGRVWERFSDGTGKDLHGYYSDVYQLTADRRSLTAARFEVSDRGALSWIDYNSITPIPKGFGPAAAPYIEYARNRHNPRTFQNPDGSSAKK